MYGRSSDLMWSFTFLGVFPNFQARQKTCTKFAPEKPKLEKILWETCRLPSLFLGWKRVPCARHIMCGLHCQHGSLGEDTWIKVRLVDIFHKGRRLNFLDVFHVAQHYQMKSRELDLYLQTRYRKYTTWKLPYFLKIDGWKITFPLNTVSF